MCDLITKFQNIHMFDLQPFTEIIETSAKNGVVLEATSN